MSNPTEEAERLLTQFPDNWSPSHREICKAVAAALTAAEVKGMQRIRKTANRHRSNTPYDERDRLGCLVNAIDAEIAKMGKPQPDETTELKAALDSVSFPDRRWK